MAPSIRSLHSDKLIKSTSLLFVAVMVTGVFNYSFQVVMGRMLLPKEYGLMNALLALFVIMVVPVTPLFTVITHKTAEYKALGDLAAIHDLHRKMSRRVILAGLCGLVLFLVLSPYLRDYLHMSSLAPIVIIGMSLVAALAYPVNLAVLQGVQDYKWLGIYSALGGPAKFLFTVLFVWAGFGVSGVMAGMVASGLLLWAMSYFPTDKHLIHAKGGYGVAKHISFTDAIPVFLAVFAFTLLTQADMVLVNRYFSAQDTAGIYASAGVLGKAVMYIPGAIVLALFPMVSEQYALNRGSRHLLIKALIMTMAISGSGAVFFYLFPVSIIGVVYGDYGLAMLPMALLMVLMNYLIAREKNSFSYIMIVGALLEIFAIILFHDSLMQIVFIMLTVGTLLLVTGIAIQYVPALQPNIKGRESATPV
jgi:O-antigen/teichoic acid export membrane protein